METVGKILSITLLTIFGAAATTVYLMDSGFLDSIVSNSPTTYIYQKRTTINITATTPTLLRTERRSRQNFIKSNRKEIPLIIETKTRRYGAMGITPPLL